MGGSWFLPMQFVSSFVYLRRESPEKHDKQYLSPGPLGCDGLEALKF